MANGTTTHATSLNEEKGILTSHSRWLFKRILAFIALAGPDLMLAVVMTLVLLVTIIFAGGHIRFFQASLGLPVGITLTLIIYHSILARFRPEERKLPHHILRDWLPFLLVTFIYENLHDLSKLFYKHDFAGVFYHWDIAIFGVEPTIWAQKIYSPILTDIMAFCYALYFVFPLVLMFFLSHEDRRSEFREMALAVTFTFLMGFIGYVAWPTSPPRYFITELYTNPHVLHGPYIFDRLQSAWDSLSVVPCGAFPSLHVGISAVALFFAWKFRSINRIFGTIWLIYIPLVLGLWFSTVYLRHHWVIDIFAGLFVAGVAYALSEYVLKAWHGFRARYDIR